MAPRKKGNKSAKRSRPKPLNQTRELPAKSMIYNGPVVDKAELQSADTHTMSFMQDITAVSTGAGLMAPVFPFENPNSAQDFSVAIQMFDEYRVLAMDVTFVPNMENTLDTANLALNHAPIYAVVDRDSNSALTAYATALNYPSISYHTLTKKWTKKMNMQGSSIEVSSGIGNAEGLWLNCQSTPTLCGSIKIVAVGLSASATYGHFILRYRVQFRGRGV